MVNLIIYKEKDKWILVKTVDTTRQPVSQHWVLLDHIKKRKYHDGVSAWDYIVPA
jgi:hypothetical protein